MANQPKAVSRTLYLDTSSAQTALDKVGRKIESFDSKLKENGKLSKKEQRELAKAIEERGKIEQQIASKTGPTYRQQSQYVKQLTNEMKNLAAGTAEFGKKLQELQKAQAVLRSIKDRMGEVDKASQGMNGGLTKMGVFIGAFAANIAAKAVTALVDFGRAAFDTGQRFEKLRVVLANTFGSKTMSDLAFNELAEFASKTPFALEELTASFLKLVNRGFRPTMDEMRKLGDLAASQGKDFDQLVEALLDAQTGEFERLKEFGIRASKANGQVTISFKGVTQTVAETDEAIRNAIISMGEMQGVAGGMAVQSDTTAGKISNLGDAFDQMASNVFNLFQPAINYVIEQLANVVSFANTATNAVRALFTEGGAQTIRTRDAFSEQTKRAVDAYQKADPTQRATMEASLRSRLTKMNEQLQVLKMQGKDQEVIQLKENLRAIADTLDAIDGIKNTPAKPAATPGKDGAATKLKAIKKEATEAEKALQALLNKLQDLGRATVRAGMVPDANKIVDPSAPVLFSGSNGAGADAAAANAANIDIMRMSAVGAKGRREAAIAAAEQARQAATMASRGTAEEIEAINLEYTSRVKEIWQNYRGEIGQLIEMTLQMAGQAVGVLQQFNQVRNDNENAAFAREQETNRLKVKQYESMLRQKLMTEGQYRKKVAELEQAEDARRRELQMKQFNRQKKLSIAQALINGANAVLNAANTQPFIPLGLLAVGMATALTAAQVAIISSQKPSFGRGGKFGRGGYLTGPSHRHGGMPVINPRTGEKEAEMEGGEIILSKATVQNNADLALPLLHASMHQGGRRISSPWQQRPYQAMQYAKLAAATGMRRFASGGVFTPTNAADSANDGLRDVLASLQDVLTNGVPAYIRYNQITSADAFKERQRQEAALRA